MVPWYDGQSPGQRPAPAGAAGGGQPRPAAACASTTGPATPTPQRVIRTLAAMRRHKDPDEIDLLRRCMRATEAGHAWARANVKPGMTELDVYCGVNAACIQAAGQPVIVYGDFAVSPGPERRGGAADRTASWSRATCSSSITRW